jgi:hypothetical protein
MIVINTGTETVNLVINGQAVSVKHTQACVISDKEYESLKNIFPSLEPVVEENAVVEEDVEEPVKPAKKKKKTK